MDDRRTASDAMSGFSDFSETPSTTTISTIAVQAGKAKIVLAVLRSNEWIRVRIQQMEPDLMEVGSSLEEARALRREHDELLMKLNMKQKDVTELLARADDLASQNKPYQEVYGAMAETLGEAWKDLNAQLEYRKMLLDQSIAFHESAAQFSDRMETAQTRFNQVGTAHDVESARRLLQQHQEFKKSILEASMSTLQEGQSLLDRIREMGMHADVQNRHATTAACYGIEHLLELLQDRRRTLEELWFSRKLKLEQCLQLLLLDREVKKVADWYSEVGDAYLKETSLGASLPTAQSIQDHHNHFELQARDIHETVLRLVRTADQLVHSAAYDAEGVKKRLATIDTQTESFMGRLDYRRKNLALAISFYSQALTALSKLDEIEVQLTSTDLPRNSAALAQRHAYLSSMIAESTTPALREGRILLERVNKDDPGAAGVNSKVTELQERVEKLENMCKARYEAGERSFAYNQLQEMYSNLNTWLGRIGQATLSQHRDMGSEHSAARDFLEIHDRLLADMKSKKTDMEALTKAAEDLVKSGDQESGEAKDKVKSLQQQWSALIAVVESRVKLAKSYVSFHKKAQQLAIKMDALEQYLKIEKLDPAEVTDGSVTHKEEKYGAMSQMYTDVEGQGKTFIKEASSVSEEQLDTRRAVKVVETIISHFSERKYVITDYYEHWKVHIVTGKEFKVQWHQFIQDARKTIDWVQKVESDFFPKIAGELGDSTESIKKYKKKMEEFTPTVQKAQTQIEEHLKTAEMLSLKGDTRGQKDQIVNELLKVHTRFQARITEYQVLINMTVKFFKSLNQLDKLIENTEKEFSQAEMPADVTKAEIVLREHESNRDKVKELINFSAEEGEQIVVRVRQQDSEAIAKDEVQKVLLLTEERRRTWDHAWDEQHRKLEQNLQVCQFYFDLKQLHNELDELQRQLMNRHGNYGSSLSSVLMTSQAFALFEKNAQVIETKVTGFVSTAETMIRVNHYDSRRIRHEVESVQKKWNDFYGLIAEYRAALDQSTKFFEVMDNCEDWVKDSSSFLLQIGRKATECKTSGDANNLIQQLDAYRTEGAIAEDGRLNFMSKIATILYGPVSGTQKMQHIVDKNQAILDSFIKAIEELGILRDNLLKKEQILAEMSSVVETTAPKQPIVPRFTDPLSNAEITEGQRFTFECKLECEKEPKIEWFKDELALTSADYQTEFKDGIAKMTIEETFSEDTAKYTCRATTEAGSAESSATLRVKETHQKVVAPDIAKHLKSQEVPEGTQFMFECHVTGIPSPAISWFKDDKCIDQSADYVITKINGTCGLKIRKCLKDHGGRYTCKATNNGGEAASTAKLNVICVKKPAFETPLCNVAAPEGKSVRMEAHYTGEPSPQIQWMKGDTPILPSSVFKIIVEQGMTALEVNEVYPEDSGSYTVVAKNLGGESRTSCLLTVDGMFSASEADVTDHEPTKPQVMQKLVNKEVLEGSRARLDCVVTGHPEPEVIWYHNDHPVKESKDFQLLFEGDRCSLIIREVYLEDSGEYRVVARNPYGQTESTSRLIVDPLSEMSDASVDRHSSEVVPPKFTQLLKDLEGTEGQKVRFECRVIGHPTPEIRWFRDGNEIVSSPDFQIVSHRELHSLTIPEVFKEDIGNFMCRAVNTAGEAKCYATLIVKPSMESHFVKTRLVESSHVTTQKTTTTTVTGSNVNPPEFQKLFGDMRVKAGLSCKFEVTITGNPKPRVRWFFNNEPVVSPDYQLQSFGDNYSLYIPEVFDEDAGRFSVVAENEAGKATCAALLVVVEESAAPPKTFSPPLAGQQQQRRPQAVHQPPLVQPQMVAPVAAAPPPPPPAPRPAPPPAPPAPKQAPAPAPPRAPAGPPGMPKFPHMDLQVDVPVPPKFAQQIKNITAKEGTRVTFQGTIEGKPAPVIRWFKTGHEITGSPDFEMTVRDGRVALSIPEVFEEDAGTYECQARNMAGTVSSTAELVVQAQLVPATFTEKLRSHDVKEGQSVRFTVRVAGKPAPQVTWYREGTQIVSSPDFEIIQEGDVHTLYIPEVFYEDSGKFSVAAANKAGQTDCTAELIVEAPIAIESASPTPPVSRSPSVGRPPARTAPFASGSSREATPPKPPAPQRPPPQFTRPLADIVVREGERVVLECTIAPYLEPERVQWFRDQAEIHHSPDYQIAFSRGSCTLTISEVFPEDAGTFTCTVTIEGLSNSTYMVLKVEAPLPAKAPPPPPPPPVASPRPQETVPDFRVKLGNLPLQYGQNAHFECTVQGYPPPEILWTRRGHPLVDKTRYKSTYDQYSGTTTLTILNLRDEDEGEYTCTAINSLGEVSTSALLLGPERYAAWLREQGAPAGAAPPPRDAGRAVVTELEQKLERVSTPRRGRESPGQFYRPMSERMLDVTAGSRMSDTEDLSTDEGFHVSQFEKRLMKEIQYREGRVQPPPAADRAAFDDSIPLGDAHAPSIEQPLKDFKLMEGSDATFVCKVFGTPFPNISWYQNGRQLKPSTRYEMKLTRDGYATLRIRVAFPEDQGHYTCCCTNVVGRCLSSSELYVERLSKIDDTSYVAPETLQRMMRSSSGRPSQGEGGVAEKFYRPVFRKIPMDQESTEGQMVRFDSIVSGRPMPELFWYRDGVRVHDDFLHKIVVNEDGIHSLIIDRTVLADNGQYTCIAKNRGGEDRFVVHLNVKPREAAQAPRFAERLLNSNVKEGEPLVLHCEAGGVPPPMMSWQKDGKMIPQDHPHYKIESELGRTTLTILAVELTDNAWFQCSAVSVSGSSANRARVIVQEKPKTREPERKLVIPRRTTPTPTREMKMAPVDKGPPKDYVDHKPSAASRLSGDPTAEADAFDRNNPKPPKFKMQLKSLTLNETQSAHFESRLVPIGDPDMQVEWYKDGRKIGASHRFKALYDFGFIALDIAYTYPEDNGTYMCVASNRYGSDQIGAQLICQGKSAVITDSQLPEGSESVQAIAAMEASMRREAAKGLKGVQPEDKDDLPPVFDLKPEPVQVEEGETAKFMAKVGGHPRPRLTWWVNGSMIIAGQRFKLRYDGMIHILEVPKAREYDSGVIRVVAKNPYGEAECSTSLSVVPREDWRSRLKQAPKFTQEKTREYRDEEVQKAFASINLQHSQMSTRENLLMSALEPSSHVDRQVHIDRAKYMLDMAEGDRKETAAPTIPRSKVSRKEPPTFTKPLTPVKVKEGSEAKLEAEFTGFPTPQVSWYREGFEIQPSRDFQITCLANKTYLYVPEVFPEDTGMYTCKAHNPFGMAQCRALLQVQADKTAKEKDAVPEFRVQMHDISIKVGEPATFDCQVSGHPRPDVYWAKNSIRMKQSNRWKFITEEDHFTLLIYEVKESDIGKYECVVTNQLGKATCAARLDVQKVVTQHAPITMTVPLDTQVAPQLITPMRDQRVDEGNSAVFQCQIQSTPEPVVQWYYNNTIIKPSKYFQMKSAGGEHTLVIAGAFPEDEGIYKCIARNQAGEVTCIAHLKVHALISEPEIDTKAEAARFTHPISSINSADSKTVRFEAVVAGQPQPKVVWFREGHQIHTSHQYQITQEFNRHTLTITKSSPQDTGIYTCRASNAAGAAECSAELKVEDVTQISKSQVQLAQAGPQPTAPKILKGPSPVREVAVGQTTRLMVQIAAFPPPRFTWYKNTKVIQPSQRFKVAYENGVVTLVIFNIQAADAGDYLLKASNDLGEITWKTTLNIQPTTRIVQLPPQTQEVSITTTQRTETTMVTEVCPTFTRPMQPEIRVSERGIAKLECQVEAYPPPRISWHVNGIEIKPSPKYVVSLVGSNSVLQVNECVSSDTGVYTCRAVSDLGEAVCSTTLYVMEPPEAPKFTIDLMDCTAADGAEVILTCTITGKPMPQISWFHNNKCIDKSEDFVITFNKDTGKSDCVIVECLPDDEGTFKCVARNSSGTAVTTGKLTIARPQEPMVVAEPTVDVETQRQTKTTRKQELDITGENVLHGETVTHKEVKVVKKVVKKESGEPPRFSQPIQPQVVKEGEDCQFNATVTGAPTPTTEWLKDKKPLELTDRMVATFDVQTMTCSLKLLKTTQEDVGVYSCRASNTAGRATCTANVVVVPAVAEITGFTIEKLEAPYFTEHLRPLRVTDGERLVLTCVVTGQPRPQIYWYHNGRNIDHDDDFRRSYDPQTGHCTLVISECFPEDTGIFKCMAVNALGQNITSAQVIVHVPSDGYTATSETSTSDDQMHRRTKSSKVKARTSLRSSLKPPPSPERRHSVTLQLPAKKQPRPEEVVLMVDIPPSLAQAAERDVAPNSYPATMSTADNGLAHKTELITKVREHRPKRRRRPAAQAKHVSELSRPPPTQLLVPPSGERKYSETLFIDRPMTPVTVEIATVTQTLQQEQKPVSKHTRRTEQTEPPTEPETIQRKLEAKQVSETTQVSRSEGESAEWSFTLDAEQLKEQQEQLELEAQRARETREHILRGRAEMSTEQTTQDEMVTETSSEPTMEIEEEKSVRIRSYGVIEDPNLAPAQFEQPTRPQVVREGENAIFSAIVKGRPLPEVKWLKDRKEVILTDRVTVEFNKVTRESTLKINNVIDSDQGNYTCQATNPISRANSTSNLVIVPPQAEVTVTEKTVSVKKEKVTVVGEQETRVIETSPQFTEAMMPQYTVNEGATATMECLVAAEPEPKIVWYKTGMQIFPSERITIEHDSGLCRLTVKNAKPEDSGEYICQAENPLGSATSRTTLIVKTLKTETITTRTEQTTSQTQQTVTESTVVPQGGPQAYATPGAAPDVPPQPLTEPCAVIDIEMPVDRLEPPRFMMPLNDQQVFDGDRAVLRVMFRGVPKPSITWYFNSQPVKASRDFQIKIDHVRGESTLTVAEVFPEDEGEYMCKAENRLGAAVTHAHLFVKLPSSSSDEEPERIVTKTVLVKKTQQQKLTAPVMKVVKRGSFSETLSIDHHSKPKEYQLQFAMPEPKKSQRAEFFTRRDSVPKGMKLQVEIAPPKIVESKMTLTQLKKQVEAQVTKRQTLSIPLVHKQRRFSETVAIDHHAKMKEMELEFKLPEKRLEKSFVEFKQLAALRGVRMEVEIAPQKQETSKMNILQKRRIEAIETQRQMLHIQLDGAPPKFTFELASINCMDGEEITFRCVVTGNPMPEITWYRSDQPVEENPDFQCSYNRKTGECILHIMEVFPQDNGEYQCIAVNPYGTAITSATLKVDVYEYVPDSEEASASQAELSEHERVISEDEAEFLEKTSAFIAKMAKIRQDIQEDHVEEEEVEMTEEFMEETVQMADVKWQIPNKAIAAQEAIMAEEITEEIVADVEMVETKPEEIPVVQTKVVEVTLKKEMKAVMQEDIVTEDVFEECQEAPEAMPQEEEITAMQVKVAQVGHKAEMQAEMQESIVHEEVFEEVDAAAEAMPQEEEITAMQVKVAQVGHKAEMQAEMQESIVHEEVFEEVDAAAEAMPQEEEITAMQVKVAQVGHKAEMQAEMQESIVHEEVFEEVDAAAEAMPQEEEIMAMQVKVAQVGHKAEMQAEMQESMVHEEVFEEVQATAEEITQQQEIVVDLKQAQPKQELAMVGATEESVVTEMITEEVVETTTETTQQEEIFAETVSNIEKAAEATHVQTVTEEVLVEGTERISPVPTEEKSTEVKVMVELRRSSVQQGAESRALTQVEDLAEEMTQEYVDTVKLETTEGHEVMVDLSQNVTEAARESLVQTQEERVSEETIYDILDRMPSPVAPTEEEVVKMYEQHRVEDSKVSHVQYTEERHSEEEEEDIFFEATEPEISGEEVIVELATHIVQDKLQNLAPTLEARMSVEDTEEAHTEFEVSETQPEKVVVVLEKAQKKERRLSMASVQEKVTVPQGTEDWQDDATLETTMQSNVEFEMEYCGIQSPTQSRVGTYEELIDVMSTKDDVAPFDEEIPMEEDVVVMLATPEQGDKPETRIQPVMERHSPEGVAEEYLANIKEIIMIPSIVRPEYEPAVIERYRLETLVRPSSYTKTDETTSEQQDHFLEEAEVAPTEETVSLKQAQKETKRFQTREQKVMMSVEAAAEQNVEFSVEKVSPELARKQSQLQEAMKTEQVIHTAQEVTEEQEVITEYTTEEISVIKRPEVPSSITPQEVTQSQKVPAQSLMAPVFELPLSDVTVTDGERAYLECRVKGVPRPTVTWHVEGRIIQESQDIKITYEEDVCTLFIADVLPDDEGEYTVKAVNEAGTCVTTAYLTVLPPSQPESPVLEEVKKVEVEMSLQQKKEVTIVEKVVAAQPEAPMFTMDLEPKVMFEHMPVTLEAYVTGKPEPEITWYKGGKKITSTDHTRLEYTTGHCVLRIDKVTVEDEAEFMCEAKNEAGVATTMAELLVEKLMNAVEQVILEEFYDVEIEMFFKWRPSFGSRRALTTASMCYRPM